MEQRKDYASWDDTFMDIAHVVSRRSKDPCTQVGACIISDDNRILSVGYNGAPNGYPDDKFPWGKTDSDPLNTKYAFVVHAERNAILNFRGNLREFTGSKVYVTHFPCSECAKEIIQSGIGEVVYREDHKRDKASVKMFDMCGVKVRKLK